MRFEDLSAVLEVAEMFEKKITVLSRTRLSPEWFDNEYKEGRKLVRRSLRRFKHDSSNENRRNYVDNKNKYELIMKQNKKKKTQAKKEQLQRGVNNLQNSKVFLTEMRALTRPFAVKKKLTLTLSNGLSVSHQIAQLRRVMRQHL